MEALPFYYGQVNQHDLEKNSLDWDELGKMFKKFYEVQILLKHRKRPTRPYLCQKENNVIVPPLRMSLSKNRLQN